MLRPLRPGARTAPGSAAPGNRRLNRALHTVAVSWLRSDEDSRAYADRRRAEAKTDRKIKRSIARWLYRQPEDPPASAACAACVPWIVSASR